MALVVYDTPEARKRPWWDVYQTPVSSEDVIYKRPSKVRRRLFPDDPVFVWKVFKYKPVRTGGSVSRKFARRRRKL